MPDFRTCAFAVYATGDRYCRWRRHLIEQLKYYVPGIPVIDLDMKDAANYLAGVDDSKKAYFARLAIPLLRQFKPYDRIIWMDVDTFVQSGRFAGILDIETGDDGIAAAPDVWQEKYKRYMQHQFPGWGRDVYCNAGIVVFDRYKINEVHWREQLASWIAGFAKKQYRWRDQDILNAFTKLRVMDIRFNCGHKQPAALVQSAWCVHYCDKRGHGELDALLDAEDMTPASSRRVVYVAAALSRRRLKPWVRAYFAAGNTSPLLLSPSVENDWDNADKAYAVQAVEFCGGTVLWRSPGLTDDILQGHIAQRFKPDSWVWLDDSYDIMGDISNVLATKTGRFDQNSKDVSSILGTVKRNPVPVAPFEVDVPAVSVVNSEHRTPALAKAPDPVDAVFVIGTGSKSNNEELRYALRNIAKHCPFVRNVFISGECPSWVDKTKVRHLQWPDRFKHAKDANIIDKLRHACESEGIAKHILFCSDDQFQTHVCAWQDFAPRYLRQYSPNDPWYANKKRTWHSRLRATLERDRQRRISAGKDPTHIFYWEPHMWMQIDRDKFLEYAKWSDYEHRTDTIIAAGYFNFVDTHGRSQSDNYDHTFLRVGRTDLPRTTHVAYHDATWPTAKAFLQKLFPQRCKYELSPNGDKSHVKSMTMPVPLKQNKLVVRKIARYQMPFPTASVTTSATPILASQNSSRSNDNPAPATAEEVAAIHRIARLTRDTPVWSSLIREVSMAEELRLFGVRGWRTVWNDIIDRWTVATNDGKDKVSITVPQSSEARQTISAYRANPNQCRTVFFWGGSRENS